MFMRYHELIFENIFVGGKDDLPMEHDIDSYIYRI